MTSALTQTSSIWRTTAPMRKRLGCTQASTKITMISPMKAQRMSNQWTPKSERIRLGMRSSGVPMIQLWSQWTARWAANGRPMTPLPMAWPTSTT